MLARHGADCPIGDQTNVTRRRMTVQASATAQTDSYNERIR